jgi:hypothetical protein
VGSGSRQQKGSDEQKVPHRVLMPVSAGYARFSQKAGVLTRW